MSRDIQRLVDQFTRGGRMNEMRPAGDLVSDLTAVLDRLMSIELPSYASPAAGTLVQQAAETLGWAVRQLEKERRASLLGQTEERSDE